MPKNLKGFTQPEKGFWWNKKSKEAHFVVYEPGRRGAQKRRTMTGVFASVEAARSAYARFRDEVKGSSTSARKTASEQAPENAPLTFSDAFEKYAEWDVWGNCAPSTRAVNLSTGRNMLVRCLGGLDVNALNEGNVTDFRTWCKRPLDVDGQPKRVYSNYTINNAQRRFREVMNYLKLKGLLAGDVPKIKLLPEDEIHGELSPEEEDAFMDAFDDFEGFKRMLSGTRFDERNKLVEVKPWQKGSYGKHDYGQNPNAPGVRKHFERFRASKVWFVAALDTGLRCSDVTNLSRRAVRFREGIVTKVMRKTGKQVTVPLAPTLEEHLRESMQRGGGDSGTDVPVIVTPTGSPYGKTTLKRYFEIAKWIAGIVRRLRFHDLRHSFGSDVGSDGYGENILMELLGHTTTAQTARYVRPHDRVLAAVRETIEAKHTRRKTRATSREA